MCALGIIMTSSHSPSPLEVAASNTSPTMTVHLGIVNTPLKLANRATVTLSVQVRSVLMARCRYDNDCLYSGNCDTDTPSGYGVCVQDEPNGGFCNANYQCASNNCVANTCVEPGK